jgi:hypothetical protein
VRYRFYTKDEGGRERMPYQGYRSDFWYEHEAHAKNSVFMIWPEFENENGEVILDSSLPINSAGTARMLIINAETRSYHLGKITTGMTGYFMEGNRRVAKCEVIEILDLHINPIKQKRANGN